MKGWTILVIYVLCGITVVGRIYQIPVIALFMATVITIGIYIFARTFSQHATEYWAKRKISLLLKIIVIYIAAALTFKPLLGLIL